MASACSPPTAHKPLVMEPIGTVPNVERRVVDEGNASVTTPNSGTPNPWKGPSCTGGDFDALDETLRQCEVPIPTSAELPASLRDKLEVRMASSTSTVVRGEHLDLTVTLHNKSNGSLPLYFSGNTFPHFEVEAVDARGRRVDMPPGRPPPWPRGMTPSSHDEKAWRVTLAAGASGKIKVSWDAAKMKWAPDKAAGWDGSGYPRAAAGRLPPGRYTLRPVLPLLGTSARGVEMPKVTIDVKK
ncbi:MAG: hypothetical protein FWD69_06765 [Polyangiaceae bacterium]|nr:hypothetical protein [Polyangiaceae bacterium]